MFGKISEKLRLFGSVACACCLLLIFAGSGAAQSKITGMQAMLFYQDKGTFSPDVFTTPSDLWNVSFDAVYSVLIVVEVESETEIGKRRRPPKLELTVQYVPLEGNRAITVRQVTPLRFVGNIGGSKSFLGFWIDSVGCDPIELSAKIRGQRIYFRKTINFGCGE